MDVSDTRDMMVRQATGMIVSMVSVVSTLKRLGRTWYCKTIWSLCWLHEQLIAMFLLLSLWFCFIAVNILVDHEELELAYDANIYTIRFTVTIHNSQFTERFTVTYSRSQYQYQVFTVTVTIHSVTIHSSQSHTKCSQSQFIVTVTIHGHNIKSQSQFTVTVHRHSYCDT